MTRCESDTVFGRQCSKDALYPWRKPRQCASHWRHGERKPEPVYPALKRNAPPRYRGPGKLRLALLVLISRLDKLTAARPAGVSPRKRK